MTLNQIAPFVLFSLEQTGLGMQLTVLCQEGGPFDQVSASTPSIIGSPSACGWLASVSSDTISAHHFFVRCRCCVAEPFHHNIFGGDFFAAFARSEKFA